VSYIGTLLGLQRYSEVVDMVVAELPWGESCVARFAAGGGAANKQAAVTLGNILMTLRTFKSSAEMIMMAHCTTDRTHN
jgi:hypothetical protein